MKGRHLVAGGLNSIASVARSPATCRAMATARRSRMFRPGASDTLEPRTLLSGISDTAYPLLIDRSTAAASQFAVYVDADSGLNHGFPSGIFGSSQAAQDQVQVNTAAVDDPNAASGISSDPNALDRSRGTVLQVTIGPQSAGEFAGVNIEDPEDWAARSQVPGASFQGYDLRGATDLVFDVRTPTPGGAWVQFGVGGNASHPYASVTDYIHIAQGSTYQTMTIPLASLRDPSTGAVSPPDLSDVNVLFSIASNDIHDPNGLTLLLDDVRYEPVPSSQASVLSMPASDATFGVVPQGQAPIPPDQVLGNLSTIYETSMTAMDLMARGMPEDLTVARSLLDAFVYALGHDNQGDPIPTASAGGQLGVGLHSGYSDGDLALMNDQDPSKQEFGLQGQVRLAGFSVSSDLAGPSHFALVLDGATGGNNAFAMKALLDGYLTFGDPRYLDAARTIGLWIVGNLTDTSGTGYGGYFLGYPDQGQAKVLQTGKSVENNADICSAFTTLSTIEAQLGDAAESAAWASRADVAGQFVLRMFDPSSGRFFAGTVPAGTPAGSGIDPTGLRQGNDVINVFDFLDSQTFTTLALAALPQYRDRIDWRLPIQHMIDTFAKTVTATTGGQARTYHGFSLVASPSVTADYPNPADGIAWEFTGQAVVAMRLVDRLYGQNTFEALADSTLAQIGQAQAAAPYGDGVGVVAATLDGENDQGGYPPVDQGLSTPFQDIPERVGLAATTWAIGAADDLNVLAQPVVATSATTAVPSLAPGSDTGASTADNLTRLNNEGPSERLAFLVSGTVPGASVVLLADGSIIGSATAIGTTTTITTDGSRALSDGPHVITARQTEPGKVASPDSSPLTIVIDATPPRLTSLEAVSPANRAVPVDSVDFQLSEPVNPMFLVSALRLTRDGVPVTLSGVTVAAITPNSFRVAGLGPSTTLEGDYVLTISASGVQDLAGNPGSGALSTSWTSTLTVLGVQQQTNRRGSITAIILAFNGRLDPSRAQNPANYRLVLAGHDRTFGTKDDIRVRLRAPHYAEFAAPNGMRSTVTLKPRVRLRPNRPWRLLASAAPPRGLADPSGRALDGDRNGLPGGDFVFTSMPS